VRRQVPLAIVLRTARALHDSEKGSNPVVTPSCSPPPLPPFLPPSPPLPFGCHISVWKVMVGGMLGKSLGKVKRALKKPPAQGVDG
jgi:hypothetical protein